MRGYRIWVPSERRVIETINVTFDENEVLSGAVLDLKNIIKEKLGYYPSYSETISEVDYEISNHKSSKEIRKEVKTEKTKDVKPEPITEIKF
ncbi:uncharacterized protein CDAR_571391 [Caerostris darwini]|uniref:Retroviral polymerase SH3-like domain-containing protein n=1 Tax=Caerostris darwini TaxID=1538125 RepID=A0AAV4SHQ0_9ARAC|nr:uncharacterized protein CDAR_571391 [Caerostris darwini]